jgi:hypothetical protein
VLRLDAIGPSDSPEAVRGDGRQADRKPEAPKPGPPPVAGMGEGLREVLERRAGLLGELSVARQAGEPEILCPAEGLGKAPGGGPQLLLNGRVADSGVDVSRPPREPAERGCPPSAPGGKGCNAQRRTRMPLRGPHDGRRW